MPGCAVWRVAAILLEADLSDSVQQSPENHSYWLSSSQTSVESFFQHKEHDMCVHSLGHVQFCSPAGCSVHGISQARILIAISSPRDLPDAGIKDTSPVLAGRFFTTEQPGKHTAVLINFKYLMAIKTTCGLNIAPQVDKICEKKI